MIKLGLVGSGVVGQHICNYLLKTDLDFSLFIYDHTPEKVNNICKLSDKFIACTNLSDLYNNKIDYLIEAASRKFLNDKSVSFLSKGINIIALSNGILANTEKRQEILSSAIKGGSKIYLPGAPPGLDIVQALSVAGIESVKYTSKRNTEHPVAKIAGQGKYFSGNIRQAMQFFKKTLNTSSVLAEAGIGYDKTLAEVIFDKNIEGYSLEVELKSSIANFKAVLDGPLDPSTKKFPYLAALSVVALLKKLTSPIVLGI